jgi:transposase
MRPQRPIDHKAAQALAQLLQQATSKADFQRVQCLWLRASLGLHHRETARAVGWSASHVKRVWSEYFKQGEAALLKPGRGGRRRQNLTLPEEETLLGGFLSAASQGGVLVVDEVKGAYEQRLGRTVPKSTVYRMLARHGWRKIAPRRRHPRNDPAQAEAFKKNCAPSSPRKSRAKVG